MKLLIKEGVLIREINSPFIMCCHVVSAASDKQGQLAVITSGCDGTHGSTSYHPVGYAWDFRLWHYKHPYVVYLTIRSLLKAIDPYFDTAYEGKKGKQHMHIEYDFRRKAKDDTVRLSTVPAVKSPLPKEKDMGAATWKWILNILASILQPLLKLVTAKFRDEISDWINKKYAEALQTENPWDDMFFEFLARALGVTLKE